MTGRTMSGDIPANEPGVLFTGLRDHPKRPHLVGEVHARSFPLMSTPRRILHFAFLVDAAEAETDRKQIGNLLRTRVDIELEHQNRSLLESERRRARLQLRLQQTVDDLSVTAIS